MDAGAGAAAAAPGHPEPPGAGGGEGGPSPRPCAGGHGPVTRVPVHVGTVDPTREPCEEAPWGSAPSHASGHPWRDPEAQAGGLERGLLATESQPTATVTPGARQHSLESAKKCNKTALQQ